MDQTNKRSAPTLTEIGKLLPNISLKGAFVAQKRVTLVFIFRLPKDLLQINDVLHFDDEYVGDFGQQGQHMLVTAVVAAHGPDVSQASHHGRNDGDDKGKVVLVPDFLVNVCKKN